MRPVRLTIQAFGPYPERVVIDFRDAVEAGLFGIYGQTGSGKSTIFSAMTFALFGEPAKSEQEAHSLRSDHAEPDMLTEAEFVFDIGTRRYVVFRRPDQMRPKARGDGETRSAHEAYLFDATGLTLDDISDEKRGKIIAEKKVREVDTAIAGMLGYGSEQFRQIVLLPQGRFEKFLSAKTKERLEILRELFDVSRYEALMADLKSEADAAEKHVREERALCVRQLAAENFESTDALITGIDAAETKFAELRALENNAKAMTQAAEKELRRAQSIEEKFKAAEKTASQLAELEVHKKEFEALGEQVRQAERARTLIDTEERVIDANREVSEAKTAMQKASKATEQANEKAKSAVKALKQEEDRSDEADALRQNKGDLERYTQILKSAEESEQRVLTSLEAQREANDALEKSKLRLAELQAEHTTKSEALKTARKTATLRSEIAGKLASLAAHHAAAKDYETALQEIQSAKGEVAKQLRISEAASARADKERLNFEAAEKNLARTQALHLAMNLEQGAPCPVCGSTGHPEPATGEIGNAGLDKAFRESRETWQEADQASRQAAEALAGHQATLKDREKRLSELEHPKDPAEAIAAKMASENAALQALGPEFDIVTAETKLEKLGAQIEALDGQRDGLRDRFEECRNQATEAKSARDSRLEEVPKDLRNPEMLAETVKIVSASLNKIDAAKVDAQKVVEKTREAALGATKDVENARVNLAKCKKRSQKAVEAFQNRLASTCLTAEAYQSLKLAIETLDTDKESVETYWRKHKSATDAAGTAKSVIKGLTRPELAELQEAHETVTEALNKAMEARVEAKARVEHLTRLHTAMEETLRKLEEAEAESGPLRELAALMNGQNTQRLTLETFAIGAMFDQVLEAANLRLSPMTSGRYQLERDLDGSGRGSRGLGIQVFDIHTGKSRATSTLSGGETFIAALALALGLADVVESASGKVRLDTIFIDEGFGSLDTENGAGTLDQVLQVLGGLVSQNRAVGLISHVPLVQEAIPNGFYVKKTISGSSIEERGLL